MEVLSDILRSMRVRGSVYFCDKLTAPWKLRFDDVPNASFHLVRRGECWVHSDEDTQQLGPGDLVFVEAGRKHMLTSHAPGQTPAPGASTLLLCGYCDFDGAVVTPLLDVFPSMTIVRDEEIIRNSWLKTALDQLSAEFMGRRPGAELVLDKLTEIVVVELIRINFGREEASPFVRALADKRISQALQRLHEKPGETWTIEGLAREVGISRAAFAKRFRELVGQPMFEYLTALRVEKAKALLTAGQLSVAEIAWRVGYESDVAFARTFRKQTGLTPAKYRKVGHAGNS